MEMRRHQRRPAVLVPRAPMPHTFTRYEKLVVAMLAFLQFMIVFDFMIMGLFGAILLLVLQINTQ